MSRRLHLGESKRRFKQREHVITVTIPTKEGPRRQLYSVTQAARISGMSEEDVVDMLLRTKKAFDQVPQEQTERELELWLRQSRMTSGTTQGWRSARRIFASTFARLLRR